jgi:hypothetical protein
MYSGNTLACCIKDERYHQPSREFVGGYYMQTMALGLSFFASRLATNLDFAGWGGEFTGTMEAYQCIAGMYLIGEDMSREINCVTLHPTKTDQFGMPVPNVHFDDHENDIAMRNHAYKHGAMVYDAVGATATDPRTEFATSGGKLMISKTCSFQTAASSQRARQKIRS